MVESILDATERAIVRNATMLDQHLIDKATEAFDALLRGDREGYQKNMMLAYSYAGEDTPKLGQTPPAITTIKAILVRKIAEKNRWTFERASKYLSDAAREKS